VKPGIFTLFFLLFIASSSYAQPAISFDQLNYDFATIRQEDQVEHVFEFANTGDQELVIERLHAS